MSGFDIYQSSCTEQKTPERNEMQHRLEYSARRDMTREHSKPLKCCWTENSKLITFRIGEAKIHIGLEHWVTLRWVGFLFKFLNSELFKILIQIHRFQLSATHINLSRNTTASPQTVRAEDPSSRKAVDSGKCSLLSIDIISSRRSADTWKP